MPRRATYQVQWSEEIHRYEILVNQMPLPHSPLPGSGSWFDWLEEIGSFAFSSQEGLHCTVLKERVQRGDTYWYGYRSLHGRTVKRYLGRTKDLSIVRLEEVAALLADESSTSQHVSRQKEKKPHVSSPRVLSSRRPSVDLWGVLLASKLHPPRLPTLQVERVRLLDLLETHLSDKLTLLQAPMGFGKTTLAAQWIARLQARHSFLRIAWVSLDASDNDPLRFWRYIIAACQMQCPSLGKDAFTLLSSPTPFPFTVPPLETVLTLLLNDLTQQEYSGLLVLDNYQSIVDSAIHQTLIFFLDHLPTTFHVLLLTRTEPPFPVQRWRAQGDLGALHMADLRFSPEEMSLFLRQAVSVPLSEATLTQLAASLEGWAAGLRLLSLTLQGQRTALQVETSLHSLSTHATSPVSPALPETLLTYVVTEILDAQPEPLQRFLLQTSMLTYLNGSLCDAVTERTDSSILLASCERDGLFLEALNLADPLGSWYRSHALWAEALRREANRRLGEEELRMRTMRASLWYEQHGMREDAIETALLAGDPPRVAVLLDQSITDGDRWNPPTLLRWLSQLPDEVLAVRPSLGLLLVLLLRFPQGKEDASLPQEVWKRIEAILQMAEEGWHGQSHLAWIGEVSAIRALNALPHAPFDQAVQYAQQALIWLPKGEPEHDTYNTPEVRVWRGVCLLILALKTLREGHFGEIRPLLQEAYACSLATDDQHLTGETLLFLGACSAARGELHQAAEYYQQAFIGARAQEQIARALLGQAHLAFEWNDLGGTEQKLQKALELIEPQNQRLSDQVAYQMALLSYAQGYIPSAQQQLATLLARQQTISTPWAWWLYYDIVDWQTRLQLVIGDLQGAQHNLDLLEHKKQELTGQQHVKRKILQARLLLLQGKPHEARHQLEQCLSFAQAHWQMRNVLEIQVQISLTHAALQQKQEAHHWLRQALAQAQSEGFLRLFLDEGEPLARLLVARFQEKAIRSYARTLLRAFAQTAGEGSVDLARPHDLIIEPLSPQEQRVLQLVIAGHSNSQIAQELIISVNTVKHHIKQLYRKLGVGNRLEASEAVRNLKLF